MTEQEHNNVQWRKVKLGDCLKQKPDYGINAPAVPYDNNLPTYLRITDITEDGCYSKKDIVSVANQAALKYVLEEGDLVFARTGASVGKTYLYDSKDGMLVFAGFLIRVKTDENVLLPEFFKYQTHTPQYKNWIAANSMRTGQPGINGNEYEEFTFSIPFKNNKPDLSAQRRIAAILASADKVIAATQKTIAKYKQIKQGMMEDLLKPKEGWKMVKLGEVGEIVTGLTYSPSNVCQEGVLVLRSSNIQDDNLCFEDNVYVDVESFNPVIENDILICVRNGSRALIGKTARITKEVEGCAFGAFMMVYRSTYNDFLYHFFKSDMFFSQVSRNIGATINSINGSDLKNMDVYMPSDIIEQRRIASILSGIDAKIAAEEKVLEKYEKVKKGLMERLLNEQCTMNNEQ